MCWHNSALWVNIDLAETEVQILVESGVNPVSKFPSCISNDFQYLAIAGRNYS